MHTLRLLCVNYFLLNEHGLIGLVRTDLGLPQRFLDMENWLLVLCDVPHDNHTNLHTFTNFFMDNWLNKLKVDANNAGYAFLLQK